MIKTGVRNDAVSSLIVSGGANCCAVLYQYDNFGGWTASFPPGDYPNGKMKNMGAYDDAVTSLKILSNGCP